MTTPAAAPADQPGGRKPGWLALTASERGASHAAVRSPNQDAVATERAGGTGIVAAVADGHGHSRHLRSARGSKLAVKIGCQVAQELADRLEAESGLFSQRDAAATAVAAADEISKLTEEFLAPAVVSRWREAVLADVRADPFTDAEQAHRHAGDDATIAYGSTLLLCVVLRGWLILAQIGDGDVVGVRADGRAMEPVPSDPQLDGLVTTSLCGSDPRADFRVAAVDIAKHQLLAVLLATDGYGNAQMVERWPSAFSEDLAWMLRDREVNWLASQLPSWAARCASSDGSADDTTVALLISPDAAAARLAGQEHDADLGSDDDTIPAVPHPDTVPIQMPVAAAEPVTMRQLAHRTAPEPVILERSTERRRDDAASHERASHERASHEPATTEIPKLRPDENGKDPDHRDQGAGRGRDGQQPRASQAGAGQAGAGQAGEEPPATDWRQPGAGAR